MDNIRMFVCGHAMSGGSANHALCGARLLSSVCTAPNYQLYLMPEGSPSLVKVGSGGTKVAGELYEMTYSCLANSLLPQEPPELELTVIELEDGCMSFAMKIRSSAVDAGGGIDISAYGGWRAYLASTGA